MSRLMLCGLVSWLVLSSANPVGADEAEDKAVAFVNVAQPGSPGRLPAQGSHRSGRARFGHPAPLVIGSVCRTKLWSHLLPNSDRMDLAA